MLSLKERKKYKLNKFTGEETLKFIELKKKYKYIPELVIKHLIVNNIENIEEYLFPHIEKMDEPFNMKDLKPAAEKIIEKIKKEPNKILIVGDYDVDGITSSSILKLYFKDKFGVNIEVYIPERSEGYGLSKKIIDYAISRGKDFIITVDNGIAAFEPIKYAKEKGLFVIITDHHPLQNNKVPEADYVINSQQPDCNYKDKYICGAGVAFNLARGIDKIINDGNNISVDKYMPILAIGTVADVVPLINENRIFVKNGINKPIYNKGLKKLLERLEITELTSTNIAFKIAPLLNSAGREGYARLGYRLFVEENDKMLDYIIDKLLEYNEARKITQNKIENTLLKHIEENKLDEKHYGFLLYPDEKDEYFNPSIVGIVASRIVEKYLKPCIIVSYEKLNLYIDNEGKIITDSDRIKILEENEIINLGETVILKDLFIEGKFVIKTLVTNKKEQEKSLELIKGNYEILNKKILKNGYIKLEVKSKYLKGSGRSLEWFDFKSFIEKLKEENLLVGGGGHAYAAGFTFRKEDLNKIQEIFDNMGKKLQRPIVKKVLEIIDLPEEKQATKEVMNIIKKAINIIEPVGQMNKQPIIAYDIGNYQDLKILGKDKKHLSVRTESGIRMLGFNKLENGKFPVFSNKFIIADILEQSFKNEKGETIKYLEFKIEDIIDKKELLDF